jgi:hypothetical protein
MRVRYNSVRYLFSNKLILIFLMDYAVSPFYSQAIWMEACDEYS